MGSGVRESGSGSWAAAVKGRKARRPMGMHDHGRIARVAPGWNSEWNEKRENEYSVGVVSLGVVVINWVSEEEVEGLVILIKEVLEGVEESNVDDGVLTDSLSSTIRNQ